jgi:hypothetical protein
MLERGPALAQAGLPAAAALPAGDPPPAVQLLRALVATHAAPGASRAGLPLSKMSGACVTCSSARWACAGKLRAVWAEAAEPTVTAADPTIRSLVASARRAGPYRRWTYRRREMIGPAGRMGQAWARHRRAAT